MCDKSRDDNDVNELVTFDKIGDDVLNKINGEYIKTKYPSIKGDKFGQKLLEERIKYLKKQKY